MTDMGDLSAGVGFLGGTFDPIHLGHIAVAREVKEKFGLAHVAIIPAFQNPLRQHEEVIAGTEDRLVMAHLATLEESWLYVDPIEIERGRHHPGPSYSMYTMRRYGMRYPDVPLTLVVGADNVAFHSWKGAEEFTDWLSRIAVVARPDFEATLTRNMAEVRKRYPTIADLVEFLPLVNIPLSSTAIREALRKGEMPSDSLHPAVERYIRKYGLYGWKGGLG